MARILAHRPSPSMVVALIALFIALGGTSYAALRIGSKNIKRGAVTSRAIKNNDVRSKDIRNGTIAERDVNPRARLVRPFGPANLSLNQATTVIAHGPFAVVAQCQPSGQAGTRLRYVIGSSEAGSAFGAPSGEQGNFGPATPEGQRVLRNTTAGAAAVNHSTGSGGFGVVAPSGRALSGALHAVVNGGTRTCRAYGEFAAVR